MKKKLKDVTLAEMRDYCDYNKCYHCPLHEDGDYGGAICTMKKEPIRFTDDELEIEIELSEAE